MDVLKSEPLKTIWETVTSHYTINNSFGRQTL